MDEPDPSNPAAVASHTLATLRRLDRQQAAFVDLLTRQHDVVGRLDSDMRDGFSLLQREMRDGLDRVDRDIREVRGGIALIENKMLNWMSAEYACSEWIEEPERRAGLS